MNREHASCAGMDPAVFYPDLDDPLRPDPADPAFAIPAAVCAGCPIAGPCVADGETRRDWDGIRGGLTGRQRYRRYRERLRRAARARQRAAA